MGLPNAEHALDSISWEGLLRVFASAPFGLFLTLSLVSSCASDNPRSGVSEGSPEVWTLSSTPVLVLGDGSSETTAFERISGVFEDRSGRVIIVDGGSAEIRVFGLDGSHLVTWGGKGDGPGEYRRPRLLGRIQNDTMVILDEQDQRISSLSVNGDPGWSLWLMGNTNPVPRSALGVLGSGQIVIQNVTFFDPAPGRVEVLTDTMDLFLLNPSDGSIVELGPSVAPAWVWTGEEQVPMPFSPRLSLASHDDRLYALNADGSALLVFGPEGLRDSWRTGRTAEPVSRAHKTAYRRMVEERAFPAEREEAWLSALEHPRLPETLPIFDKVLASSDGEVWARRYHVGHGPKRWDVFSEEGDVLGFAETPGDLSIHQVTEGHVLGVVRDSLGVESVAVFEKQAVMDSALIAAAWEQVRAELSSLVELERIHFADYGTYTSSLDSLVLAPTTEHPDVAIEILSSGRLGFSAGASHPALGVGEGCAVFWGRPNTYPEEPASPQVSGEILCSNGETGASVDHGSR